MLINWDYFYTLTGTKEFIYFISSSSIQDALFPVKIVFIFFGAFFFCAAMWFYVNSSYVQYNLLQDPSGFLSRQSYGLKKITNRWKRIRRVAQSGTEADLKLAIIEADDFLYETLQDRGFKGENFEQLIEEAGKKSTINLDAISQAHLVRNSIVYNGDFKLETASGKEILDTYEKTVKSLVVR